MVFSFYPRGKLCCYIYYVPTSWMLLPSNGFLRLSKGKIVNRQELIDDNTNEHILNQLIKEHLTDFVIEYNTEVSEQRVPGEG